MGIQAQHATQLRLQLTALEHSIGPADMNALGWRLYRFMGDRAGFHAVSVSGNWRLVTSTGELAKLNRPLDIVAISDRAVRRSATVRLR